jgi:hypothetical protein
MRFCVFVKKKTNLRLVNQISRNARQNIFWQTAMINVQILRFTHIYRKKYYILNYNKRMLVKHYNYIFKIVILLYMYQPISKVITNLSL